MTAGAVAGLAGAAAFLMMLAELRLSRTNERRLRARGAREPAGDVYRTMQWAYPACFAVMTFEGALTGPAPGRGAAAGAAVFVAAKALKYWAIGSLGQRWTFRVLVPPDAEMVTRGPYAWMRHPNYLAVLGELTGMALLVGAPAAGAFSLLGFGALLRRRIAVEDRALRRQVFTRT